ncbi:MAG TPA: flagellar basal body-associated FliL family protein [Caldimonas sp.]|nr:flagellar basal body-associated FliL family protein [Caldimonas sp.]
MSAVIAADAAAGAAPAKGGKKKLLVMVAVAVVVLLVLGAGTVVILKKRAAAHAAAQADDDGTAVSSAKAEKSHESMGPPTYLPLDPFVVNLADKEGDRYAQIGITLEIESSVMAEQMRGYMPSIRNAILMVITRKTSRELLEPLGKEQLADEIAREAVRPMGIEIAAPQPVTSASAASASTGGEAVMASTKRHGPTVKNPIRHVNFSSFIIQ